MSPFDAFLLLAAFVLILVGAELFTNGVEWLGHLLGMSEGATGSILAAIGTATPETLVPIVAILFTNSVEADDIGVGAILGAPFMLGTLVMLLIGATAFFLRKRRGRTTLRVDRAHASRDLGFFLVMYSAAVAIALIPPLREQKGVLGWAFLPTYGLYLFLVLRTPVASAADIEEAAEEHQAFDADIVGQQIRLQFRPFQPLQREAIGDGEAEDVFVELRRNGHVFAFEPFEFGDLAHFELQLFL